MEDSEIEDVEELVTKTENEVCQKFSNMLRLIRASVKLGAVEEAKLAVYDSVDTAHIMHFMRAHVVPSLKPLMRLYEKSKAASGSVRVSLLRKLLTVFVPDEILAHKEVLFAADSKDLSPLAFKLLLYADYFVTAVSILDAPAAVQPSAEDKKDRGRQTQQTQQAVKVDKADKVDKV